MEEIKRGDIYLADLNPDIGSVYHGIRPVLVISNDKDNGLSMNIIIAEMTSKLTRIDLPTHVKINCADSGLNGDSIIQLEDIRTIKKKKLGKKLGHVSPEIMKQVDKALNMSLGIKTEEIKMDKLIPIEHKNQRVLTTQQLAEGYTTETDNISKNFTRNQDRYINGIHYFILEGEDLKTFKANRQIDGLPSNVNKIFLWTEKGALLHAKSLNTDKAWEVYQELVDTYFRVKEIQKAVTQSDNEIIAFGYGKAIEKIKLLQEENAQMLPKAQSYDVLMDAAGCLTINEVAKILDIKGLGQNNFFKMLVLENIIYRKGNDYLPYQDYKTHFVVKQRPLNFGDVKVERSQIYLTTHFPGMEIEFLFAKELNEIDSIMLQ